MTHTIQHGKRHEIEFYEPPTPEQWAEAIKEILGPDCAYMCVSADSNRTLYTVQEVDIQQAATKRSLKLSGNTKVVPTTIICATCKSQFEVLYIDFAHTQISSDMTKQRYRHFTKHCPNCPAMSVDAWLAYLGYHLKPPTPISTPPMSSIPETEPTASDTGVDMADFD